VWEVATGKELQKFTPDKAAPFKGAVFTPDSKQVLARDYADHNLYLLDLATGKAVRQFKGHQKSVTSAVVSSDGRLILSGSETRPSGSGTWPRAKSCTN
jgi:WD40 repeat protein